ncbi:hypothetical protein NQ318_004310 [Aromia moschata]|uniref:Uncharacterized protein n=1 Tax=Aromia moschata TaxID=1265417 RepID=A0AAV8YQ12_9CUCU|nr:hypothetical protein NQ318_004310 [Aromia moschata]
METTASVQLQDLLGRLNEAERRAKLLKIEVNNIRQEIVSLQRTVAGNAVTSAQRILQPLKRKAQNKTIILLDSPPDPAASRVDGPTTSKRQAEESDAVENKKPR